MGNKKLGRMPNRSDVRTLQFAHFMPAAPPPVPKSTRFWRYRSPFSYESWGNDKHGCCTIAKQANMFRRFERLELKRTIAFATEEVLRVYYDMTAELYGGGDTGAYEEDALSRMRKPDLCLRDLKGRPFTIDAYIRVNAYDHDELRRAIALSAGHGMAVCLNLPYAFSEISSPKPWDIPDGQPLVGKWQPGTWGGHSLWSLEYDEKKGILLEHTWKIPPQWLSWKAAAAYLDEAHIVIDSIDVWRKRLAKAGIKAADVVSAVNAVSSTKIKV